MSQQKKKRVYDDDDGRVVADMSDAELQPLLLPRFRRKQDDGATEFRPMSKEDRRAVLLGSIGAVLLIAGVFIVAAAVVIFVMTKIWA